MANFLGGFVLPLLLLTGMLCNRSCRIYIYIYIYIYFNLLLFIRIIVVLFYF
jgi:hypothetical protein